MMCDRSLGMRLTRFLWGVGHAQTGGVYSIGSTGSDARPVKGKLWEREIGIE